jgi:hypothetical protein
VAVGTHRKPSLSVWIAPDDFSRADWLSESIYEMCHCRLGACLRVLPGPFYVIYITPYWCFNPLPHLAEAKTVRMEIGADFDVLKGRMPVLLAFQVASTSSAA